LRACGAKLAHTEGVAAGCPELDIPELDIPELDTLALDGPEYTPSIIRLEGDS
jgi:hypothetical protein